MTDPNLPLSQYDSKVSTDGQDEYWLHSVNAGDYFFYVRGPAQGTTVTGSSGLQVAQSFQQKV
ncbi:hypothetical protein [Niabella soli]|uniref:hypothetical protein n=1 Tax=Niabella soli TaxID=446683 RepID=UPI0012F83B22|nr:hypothetical protein [Niabella soli]